MVGMKDKTNQIKTLQQAIAYFSNPDNALDYMANRRWPNGVECPTCGRKDVVFLKNQRKWQCKSVHPKRQFSAKVGTIFEDSPIALEKWLMVVWMLSNCKNGVSSYEIARNIGVTQKSAWFMLHRIRLAMKSGSLLKFGSEGGPVEADETFVGPNPRKMHKTRRAKLQAIATANDQKYRTVGKTIVMGLLDREMREVRAWVVPDVKRATLQEKVLNNVAGGAQVITDDYPAYKYALADKFVHDIIDHSKAYVSGQVHTNGIENFWSLLKRGLRGTYVAVEPFHLDRYIDEQIFRFNNRGSKDAPVNDNDRFEMLLSQVAGKRLTYSELTGKNAAEAF